VNEHLEIYKIVVGSITANEGRRQRATAAYLSMIAAIATASVAIPNLPLIVPTSAIFVIALTWLATVLYFRRLAQAKFAVINEIEKELIFPAFQCEWRYFKDKRGFFSMSLTYIEMVVPAGAAVGSVVYIMYWFFCKICFPDLPPNLGPPPE